MYKLFISDAIMKKEYREQQKKIKFVKTFFSQQIEDKLNLIEVQAPILSRVGDGTQDNLSGIEKAVQVNVKSIPDAKFEVVHSLAKWKRKTLADFDFIPGEGLYTHMKALRPDEEKLSPIHSVYVDQWDWERVMADDERHLDFLKQTVRTIYSAIKATEKAVAEKFSLPLFLPDDIHFIHAEQLANIYPKLDSKSREKAITKEKGAIFIMGIGGNLSNGLPHDVRAPDYDDWTTENSEGYHGLNGDIIVWNPVLQDAFEISSMGIRVNPTALQRQLVLTNDKERINLAWHQALVANQMPQTIGGGIGQSRLAMLLLQAQHIGQVQSSVWSKNITEQFSNLL